MKESMMNKAKKFWAAHKYKIMGVLTLAGIGTYAYCKYRQSHLSDEEINSAIENVANGFMKEADQAGSLSAWDEKENDPKYQLANGGWVTDEYFVDGDGIREFIVNDVPLANIGTLGDDLVARLNEQFPDQYKFELGSMIVDIYCNKEEPAA